MTSGAVKSFFIFFLHIIYMHFAWIELSSTFPKLISMVASAHIHTQSHLKDLWEKSSLDDRPRWVLCVFSMVGNLKNQSSCYLLRALLLALRSRKCRAVLVCGSSFMGAMQASIKSRWHEAQSIQRKFCGQLWVQVLLVFQVPPAHRQPKLSSQQKTVFSCPNQGVVW